MNKVFSTESADSIAEPRGKKVTVARVLSRNFGLGGSVDTCIIFGSFHVTFC